MQTCFLSGLRGPNPRSLSARAERDERHAKGRGVSIRLSLWKPSPQRPGRGRARPLSWTRPRGANETASADCIAQFSAALWSGSGKRTAIRQTCTKLGSVLCAAMLGNDSAVSAGLMQGPFFLLHPGALFFFRPAKKEEGAEAVSPKNNASLQCTVKKQAIKRTAKAAAFAKSSTPAGGVFYFFPNSVFTRSVAAWNTCSALWCTPG